MKHGLLNFVTIPVYINQHPLDIFSPFKFQYRLMFFWKREMCPRQSVQIFGLFSFLYILGRYK